jgi:hypothetical protein
MHSRKRERKKYEKSPYTDEAEAVEGFCISFFANADINPFQLDQDQHAGGPLGDGCSAEQVSQLL